MKHIFLLISCLSTSFVFGQVDTTLFGAYNNTNYFEFGRFYIQVYVSPNEMLALRQDSVVLWRNNQSLLSSLEEEKDYTIQTKVVEIRPTYTTYQIGEPQFDTIIEEKLVIIKKEFTEIEPMPQFKNQISTDKTEIFPKTAVFKFLPIDDTILINAIQPCMSINDYTPIIGTMVEIPAAYATSQSKIIKKWGKWYRKILPSETLVRREKIIFKHMTVYPESLPQILDTFQVIVFSDSIFYQKSTYSVFKQQKIENKYIRGYFSEWREYICYAKDSPILVLKIQEALRQKGYEVDLTNEFDTKTKRALIQFQKKNNLPQEVSDFKILMEMLGINDM